MIERRQNGQSILEYTTLIGVVIAALLIMQMFIKRGYQGGLKESADKLGDTFSPTGTNIQRINKMGDAGQTIIEEIGTTQKIEGISGKTVKGTVGSGAYSYSSRSGADQTATTKVRTDSAITEKARWSDYGSIGSNSVANFDLSKQTQGKFIEKKETEAIERIQ